MPEQSGFMKIEEALGIVMELARDNALNPESDEWANEPELQQVVKDQQTALDTVEDFLANVVLEDRHAPALLDALQELSAWMRAHTGPGDGTHEMLCRAVEAIKETGEPLRDDWGEGKAQE